MTLLWSKIEECAEMQPSKVALIGENKNVTWLELHSEIRVFVKQLEEMNHHIIAFYADNSPEWVIVDLACQLANITLLPLPMFFSDQQLKHAVNQAGATALLHRNDRRIIALFNISELNSGLLIPALSLVINTLDNSLGSLPDSTDKITFTSGSTGQPKGVCLTTAQQLTIAQSLLNTSGLDAPKHLSVLPFSTLLENIGGIYAPLLDGGIVITLPQSALGFNGSNGFDIEQLTSTISHYKPESMILLPELLLALIGAVKRQWQVPSSLRFIAVGGSKVSVNLLQLAEQSGLPVYQGYGLSECGSVVSVNSPSDNKTGSIGKPLPHLDVVIEQGEIVVSGSSFLGYVNESDSWLKQKVYTGDMGYFDDQNYLHITGRKKNLLISSFGRNINPEWIESELLSNGLLQQCVVFGDAQPYCIALLIPRDKEMSQNTIQIWIDTVNRTLPDYAQIKIWSRLSSIMTFSQELMTSNGRPVRNKIYQQYQQTIEQLYKGEK